MPPVTEDSDERSAFICSVCQAQVEGSADVDPHHWRGLNETVWSTVPAVQVLSYRMLHKLSGESWAQDILGMVYLDDELRAWAEAGMEQADGGDDKPVTRDSNGTILSDGDNVTLIKDLPVKGAGFTAKQGTLVKNISLTANPEHVEGKVNGTQIVLVAAYLKKAS